MPPVAAGLLVFFTSAAILVLEILAGRMLAPYVGVTLETFTGIIGTVLAGISFGSWAGGRVADRIHPRRLLGPLVVAGGVLALAAPLAVATAGAAVRNTGPLAIVILAGVGFFAPAAVLSAVTPTVVKLQLRDLDVTGTIVGRLSALATAGAIVGTFVTGFALVAALPSRTIVLGVGAALVVAGAGVWWVLWPDRTGLGTAVVIGVLAVGTVAAVPGACDRESPYFCASVIPEDDDPSRRLLLLDTVRHSYVDVDDPTHLQFTYAQTMSDVLATLAPPGEPLDVLHVGGGGFTMPRYVRATRPGSRNVVLELDPMLVRIAEDELGLERGPDLQVITGDARLTLAGQPEGAFDVVIGDAFGGLAVPWHLTTVEFLTDLRARLRPGGVYAMNLIDYPPLGFARAEVATLRAVFDHVAVLAPPDRLSGDDGGNFVVVASDAPLGLEAILGRNAARGDNEAALVECELDAFVGDAAVLTDDHAPVDQLLTTRR
ncbi:MAG: fused MFS/spermidine synthase [Nitriliruptorales bacterium]